MKVIAEQGNLVETAELARRFAHDEFAKVIGVEVLSEGDIANFLLDRLASMRFSLTPGKEPAVIQRVHACVYALPVSVRHGGADVIEVRLAIIPKVQHVTPMHVVIAKR